MVYRFYGDCRRRKCAMRDREFTPLSWIIVPTSLNHVPNLVLQPPALARVRWTRWSSTKSNTGEHVTLVATVVRNYPRQDLLVIGKYMKHWYGS